MTTTFYLIRHGETDWNATGRWQGHADVPLNSYGRAQAQLLAQSLYDNAVAIDGIYSSDLKRAFDTAQAIGAALDLPVHTLQTLREIDIGTWSGHTNDEIELFDADSLARMRAGEDVKRGGAESTADLQRRMVAAIEQLVREHPGETLALVSHGGSIRAVIGYVAQYAGTLIEHGHIGNTSVSTITHTASGWRVGGVNDMSHLVGAPRAEELVSAPPDDAERV